MLPGVNTQNPPILNLKNKRHRHKFVGSAPPEPEAIPIDLAAKGSYPPPGMHHVPSPPPNPPTVSQIASYRLAARAGTFARYGTVVLPRQQ